MEVIVSVRPRTQICFIKGGIALQLSPGVVHLSEDEFVYTSSPKQALTTW